MQMKSYTFVRQFIQLLYHQLTSILHTCSVKKKKRKVQQRLENDASDYDYADPPPNLPEKEKQEGEVAQCKELDLRNR